MSPRNVRAAWLAVNADDAREHGIGPRSRSGFLSGRLTLRTAAGAVSDPPIAFDAGGANDAGSARLALAIPPGYVVDLGNGTTRALTGWLHIIARPGDDR